MEASNQDTTKTEQLSTQRPTQLSEIYVRQQDFEDSFIANIYSQCDDIEKTSTLRYKPAGN